MNLTISSSKSIIIVFFTSIYGGIHGSIITINKFGLFHEETLFIPFYFLCILFLTYMLHACAYTYKIKNNILSISFLTREIKNKKLNEIHIFYLGVKQNYYYNVLFLIDNKKYHTTCTKEEYFLLKDICHENNIELLPHNYLDMYLK